MTKNEIAIPSENDIISTSNVNFVKCNFDVKFSTRIGRMEASPRTK